MSWGQGIRTIYLHVVNIPLAAVEGTAYSEQERNQEGQKQLMAIVQTVQSKQDKTMAGLEMERNNLSQDCFVWLEFKPMLLPFAKTGRLG